MPFRGMGALGDPAQQQPAVSSEIQPLLLLCYVCHRLWHARDRALMRMSLGPLCIISNTRRLPRNPCGKA